MVNEIGAAMKPTEELRCYKTEGIDIQTQELVGTDYVILDILKPVTPGALVLGIKDGKVTAWKYSEADKGAAIAGRIVYSWSDTKSL